MTKPAPFRIHASDDQLQDLRTRLRNTRWPESEVVNDWSQGTPLSYVQEVATYWADQYDWRSRETALNCLTQWRGEADGFGLHFVHMRSPLALAAVLPKTLGELGIVGCSISDLGANGLLKWAANASDLRMICIENNNVTETVWNSYRQLRETSPSLSVFL